MHTLWNRLHLELLLRIKVQLPILLDAVKTVEGDFRFCWTISPNVGQTKKENPNLVRIFYMAFTLNDIDKQYNKLHKHYYTKISSLRCAEDRNLLQNASDLYTKYRSYAEHCKPCTRLSGVNWWKNITLNCSYRIFIIWRSQVSPVFWAQILRHSVLLSVFSLMCIYTTFLFSRFHQMYKISAIYSVNGSQESRETWNISPACDKYSEWLK